MNYFDFKKFEDKVFIPKSELAKAKTSINKSCESLDKYITLRHTPKTENNK